MLDRSRIDRPASLTVLMALSAAALLTVSLTDVAAASHDGATLNVTPENDVTLVSRSTPLTATLSEPPIAPVTVNFEITGDNDLDGDTPITPDLKCTTADTDKPATAVDETTECRTSYIGTMTGTDIVRGFIADAERDDTEGHSSVKRPGSIPEPDQTDVVTRRWFQELPPGTTLDCNPETATNPASGEGSSESYNCTVKGPDGSATPGVTVDGENLSGVNDPDDSAASGTADYNKRCKTDATGSCAVIVASQGEAGIADICFWTDEGDTSEFNPQGAEYNGGKCDEETPGSDSGAKTDVVTKTWKFQRSVTISKSALTVTFGGSVTLSGSISSNPSCRTGKSVMINRNPVGGANEFMPFKTATTGSAGSYSLAFKPSTSAAYKARVSETDKCFGADSGSTTVLVRKKVTLSVSDKTPRRGQVVKFTTSVAPCSGHQGDAVRLLKKVNGTFKQVAQKSTGSACSAVFKRTVTSSGTYLVRSPQQDADHLGGQSSPRKVRVR